MKKSEKTRLTQLFNELDKEAEDFYNKKYGFKYYDFSQFSRLRRSIIDEGDVSNFSNLDNVQLNVKLIEGLSEPEINIFAPCYNILNINNGVAGLKYM